MGVNDYINDEELQIPLLEMDPEGYKRQVHRIDEVKATRNAKAVEKALAALRVAAEGTENTMPYILDAVHQYATLQEIMDIFRDVFGEYQETAII